MMDHHSPIDHAEHRGKAEERLRSIGGDLKRGGGPSNDRKRIPFGHHDFDLLVVERIARKHLGYARRLDLEDDVISDATLALIQVPPEPKVLDPDGYAATTTRNKATAALQTDERRWKREERSLDYIQLLRDEAERRLRVERMADAFLVFCEAELIRLAGSARAMFQRQLQICDLVLDGMNFNQIALIVKVDRKTVYSDLRRLYTIFETFCENFDPDDPDPPPGGHPTNNSGKETSKRSRNDFFTTLETTASRHHLIGVSKAIAMGVINDVVDRNKNLYKKELPSMKSQRYEHDNALRTLAEFRRLTLNLPAFRGLGFAMENAGTTSFSTIRPHSQDPSSLRDSGRSHDPTDCDSLDEILDRLVAGSDER